MRMHRSPRSDGTTRSLALAMLVSAALVPTAQAKKPPKIERDGLLQVQTPDTSRPAAAHPFVNVIVRFGSTSSDAAADPATFRAKLGVHGITDLFTDDVENGQVVGKRAQLPPELVQTKGGKNLLKLRIRSEPQSANGVRRTFRDSDRVKFRATVTANTPPVATAAASASIIAVDTPITFDASGSHDDDLDALTYAWDFGDGTAANGKIVTHSFAATDTDRIVTVSVSDGQAVATHSVTLRPPAPACDPNILPGTLAVQGNEALELGAVALGGSTTKTFTVRNSDPGPTSQLKVRIDVDGAGFAVEPAEITLDAGASMPVTVRFTPGAAGHTVAHLTVLPCDGSQAPVALLAHGYGGSGGATGPSLAGAPVYSSGSFGQLQAWWPDGTRTAIDLAAGHCVRANGLSSNDLCIANRDCRGNETCASGGAQFVFDTTDFCGDDQNTLYLLASNAVNDPEDLVTGSLVRFNLAANGGVTGRTILRTITEGTEHIACDRLPAGSGGSVYLAERHPTPGETCDREEREALAAIDKNSGDRRAIGGIDRIDAFEVPSLDACNDDLSPVEDLEVTPDGTSVYFIGGDSGGLYRLRPTVLPILRRSTAFRSDRIQIHPAGTTGTLLYATSTDIGSTSQINLFALSPEQAENGALTLEDLSPCAVYSLPNQRTTGSTQPGLRVSTFAAGPGIPAGHSTVLVSAVDGAGLSSALGLRATVAFDVAADARTCAALGVVNLELAVALRF